MVFGVHGLLDFLWGLQDRDSKGHWGESKIGNHRRMVEIGKKSTLITIGCSTYLQEYSDDKDKTGHGILTRPISFPNIELQLPYINSLIYSPVFNGSQSRRFYPRSPKCRIGVNTFISVLPLIGHRTVVGHLSEG